MANNIKVKIHKSMDETIRKVGGKFVVYPERGGKRLGTHDTEEDAKKQLAAIEISKAQNEAVIATKDGDKEVKASRGETEHFFVHKSGKRYIVTHKPSGKALPAVVTKYGTKLSDFQKVMKDLEDANIAGIGDENPSIETLRAIKDVLKKIDERCQKGYKTHATRKTKVMFGKRYRNCVKAEE
jgi:molybdenum-dependent DNA-binding transcriptional regulator ModE